MALPLHSFRYRVDNKLYRIQTPHVPIVQTETQEKYHLNDYPTGTNSIVAVISYTGFDMEDAMIINKSSYDRGFQHGTVYKTEMIDLQGSTSSKSDKFARYFSNTVSADSE